MSVLPYKDLLDSDKNIIDNGIWHEIAQKADNGLGVDKILEYVKKYRESGEAKYKSYVHPSTLQGLAKNLSDKKLQLLAVDSNEWMLVDMMIREANNGKYILYDETMKKIIDNNLHIANVRDVIDYTMNPDILVYALDSDKISETNYKNAYNKLLRCGDSKYIDSVQTPDEKYKNLHSFSFKDYSDFIDQVNPLLDQMLSFIRGEVGCTRTREALYNVIDIKNGKLIANISVEGNPNPRTILPLNVKTNIAKYNKELDRNRPDNENFCVLLDEYLEICKKMNLDES